MRSRNELICAWSGVAFTLVFMMGWVFIAQFVPPPSPLTDAVQIAAIYAERTWQIRLGLLLMMASCGLACPFLGLVSTHLKRIEGASSPMALTQIVAGAVSVIFILLPTLIFTAAAFRPERSAELTLILSDLAWITLLMPFPTFMIQNLAIGIVILGDRASSPVFPRWVGFLNLWIAAMFIPGGLLTFFKHGPFAWDGVFVFWIPLIVFFGWYLVMFWFMRRAAIAESPAN